MVNQRGGSRLGCLIPLLILAVGAYFAADFGAAYFRYYRFKDAMGQEARFATTTTDEQITTRLSALADSLQLPAGAELITISRSQSLITISSDYDEIIRLPLKKERVIHFHPYVVSRLL
jgi:nitric oxide reductase large subunit